LRLAELKNFFMPLEIERRLECDGDDVLAYWMHWTPNRADWLRAGRIGDELIVERLHRDGLVEGGDSDWTAWLELESLNPVLAKFNFGSSDEAADYVLLVDKVHNRFYAASIDTPLSLIMKLVGVKPNNGDKMA